MDPHVIEYIVSVSNRTKGSTMSMETMEDLNTYTLIGMTDKRGNAWHYREDLQGDEPNHYAGAIPVADVQRRLFYWTPGEAPVSATVTTMDENGVHSYTIMDEGRKAILRPPGTFGENDPGAMLGLHKEGYKMHDCNEWLIQNVANLLDDDLGISSAGLLAGGAQAWVEVSIPESIKTPEGVTFRPNLLATTSLDGTLATTYKRSINYTVCDNTRAMVLAGAGEVFRVKHTRNSVARILDARSALNMVHTMAEDEQAEIAALCNMTVTDRQWAKFLDSLVPMVDEKNEVKTGRALTMAEKKREELSSLWNYDERVTPWKNTAHGVLQAVNTWAHHVQTVKGNDRAGRNMSLTVSGGFDKLDTATMDTLNKVLITA